MRRDAHVVVIGCGAAGLLAGIRLSQAGIPFTEKNGGPGGTCWENRYPGARVDVPQMVWAHASAEHSHLEIPDGRIFTLSPWPIPTDRTWTKRFDPDDSVPA